MHKLTLAIQVSVLVMSFSVSAIGANLDLSKLPPASPKEGVTFNRDILPMLEASCVQCHSGEKPKDGLRLDTLADALKGTKHSKVIIPGKSAESKLVIAIARLDKDSAMPPAPKPPKAGAPADKATKPAPKPLSLEEVALVRAWIDQGAK